MKIRLDTLRSVECKTSTPSSPSSHKPYLSRSQSISTSGLDCLQSEFEKTHWLSYTANDANDWVSEHSVDKLCQSDAARKGS